jgi:hypothetical protein
MAAPVYRYLPICPVGQGSTMAAAGVIIPVVVVLVVITL